MGGVPIVAWLPSGTTLVPNTWGPSESEESEASAGAQSVELKEPKNQVKEFIYFFVGDVSHHRPGRIRGNGPGNTGNVVLRMALGAPLIHLRRRLGAESWATLPSNEEFRDQPEWVHQDLARICRGSFSTRWHS